MMNMESRTQYLKELRTEYLQTKDKRERGRLLNEAEKRTRLERKYLIKKLKPKSSLDKLPSDRKKRKVVYGGAVKTALAACWEVFDHPCGQRLKPSLETETDRLRKLGELQCSDETAAKLKAMSFRTIDEKLKHTKEVERLKQKYQKKIHPLLYEKVPVKVFAEQDRTMLGNIQLDLVEHCGQSAAREFLCTLSTTDIATGWWEGEAVMGRGQERTFQGIKHTRARYPFPWNEVHSDNGTEFINWHLHGYCKQEKLDFTRSRPYKKNDNCLVEQKNWTHVKKFTGYLRYDTPKEQQILNDLYRNELRLYKNFFQPVMKLVSKERMKGRIYRKYDKARTPYQRVMESRDVSGKTKQQLQRTYESLNPAELKRTIDTKLDALYETYEQKHNAKTNTTRKAEPKPNKKQKPRSVRFFIAQPDAFRSDSLIA
jgi:hypothetical protein